MSRRASEHLMIGPRGRAVVPRSESDELADVANLLEALYLPRSRDEQGRIVKEALRKLDRLREQVKAGYHRNPGGVYAPFKIIDVIGTDVHSIAYKHAKDGKLYQHDFQRRSAEVLAVERHSKRDLLITSPEGVPLWDEF